jgi:hypothetical protein
MKAIAWNVDGPAGRVGLDGPAGLNGPAGPAGLNGTESQPCMS